jgi:hypothetical protein
MCRLNACYNSEDFIRYLTNNFELFCNTLTPIIRVITITNREIMRSLVMRNCILIFLVVLLSCFLIAADIAHLKIIPVEAAALYSKLMQKVQPMVRQIINEQALKLRQGSIDEHAVSGNLTAIFSTRGIAGMDISEAAFLVVMQATKDMDKDINNMMEKMKAFTSAKQKLRDLTTKVSQDVAKNVHKKDNEVCAPPSCGGYRAAMMEVDPILKGVSTQRMPLIYRDPTNIGQLRILAKDLKGRLDGLNEMSEMTSLRLQMTMDRRSKFISTLNAMMKKISSTQGTLIQNIK